MSALNPISTTEDLSEAQSHWVGRAAFPLVLIALLLTECGLMVALQHRAYWLAVPLVLIASHFMHGLLIGFHEASHGLLRSNRRINELDGVLAGILSFMSFSLYRAAHQTHHAYLATERDEELWPFVLVDSPRWLRCLAAFLELNAGLLYTPALFLRIFFRQGSPIRNRRVRRRIWAEYGLVVVVWTAIFCAVAHWHVWPFFFWMYLGPAILAGNLQSWRKFIEHVGLSGITVRGSTRSIVAGGWTGRLLSLSLLHEPYHGVHHLHVGLRHPELPRYAASLNPEEEGETAPFPSYRSALLDLVRNLPDPRVGRHWERPDPCLRQK